jgi:hypothetical protein
MTKTEAKFFLVFLEQVIVYMRRHGGNKNTYQLEKLMQVKQEIIEMYGLEVK